MPRSSIASGRPRASPRRRGAGRARRGGSPITATAPAIVRELRQGDVDAGVEVGERAVQPDARPLDDLDVLPRPGVEVQRLGDGLLGAEARWRGAAPAARGRARSPSSAAVKSPVGQARTPPPAPARGARSPAGRSPPRRTRAGTLYRMGGHRLGRAKDMKLHEVTPQEPPRPGRGPDHRRAQAGGDLQDRQGATKCARKAAKGTAAYKTGKAVAKRTPVGRRLPIVLAAGGAGIVACASCARRTGGRRRPRPPSPPQTAADDPR